MDDTGVGGVLRAVRIHRGLRQADVARLAGVSQVAVSRAERGHVGALRFDALRAIANALEVRLEIVPSWRGGDLPRLINTRHTALHEALPARLAAVPEWETAPEVSFSIYRERGVIDRLAFHRPTAMLAVFELKSDLVDPAGLVAQLDRYRRLAPLVAADRGWRASAVSCWAVIADTSSNRRLLMLQHQLLRGAFPADGRRLGGWLHHPNEPVQGLAFLSYPRPSTGRQRLTRVKRVRVRPEGARSAPRPAIPVRQSP